MLWNDKTKAELFDYNYIWYIWRQNNEAFQEINHVVNYSTWSGTLLCTVIVWKQLVRKEKLIQLISTYTTVTANALQSVDKLKLKILHISAREQPKTYLKINYHILTGKKYKGFQMALQFLDLSIIEYLSDYFKHF